MIHMKCPVDNTELVMTERQGVEIDYCPKCRGVWLDRGELDKIIDRSAERVDQEPPRKPEQYREEDRYQDQSGHGQYRKHKRGGLLGDLFDF